MVPVCHLPWLSKLKVTNVLSALIDTLVICVSWLERSTWWIIFLIRLTAIVYRFGACLWCNAVARLFLRLCRVNENSSLAQLELSSFTYRKSLLLGEWRMGCAIAQCIPALFWYTYGLQRNTCGNFTITTTERVLHMYNYVNQQARMPGPVILPFAQSGPSSWAVVGLCALKMQRFWILLTTPYSVP